MPEKTDCKHDLFREIRVSKKYIPPFSPFHGFILQSLWRDYIIGRKCRRCSQIITLDKPEEDGEVYTGQPNYLVW